MLRSSAMPRNRSNAFAPPGVLRSRGRFEDASTTSDAPVRVARSCHWSSAKAVKCADSLDKGRRFGGRLDPLSSCAIQ